MLLKPEAIRAQEKRARELEDLTNRATEALAPLAPRTDTEIERGEIQAALIRAVLRTLEVAQ